jgi:hypothetical protein
MASREYIRLEGVTELMKTFDDIPRQIQIAGIRGAARKASAPLINRARHNLARLTKKSTGYIDKELDSNKFSKAKYAARSIQAVSKKSTSFSPGVRIIGKGADIPMNGGKEFWNIQGYLKLMAAGAYKVRKRKTSSGSNRGSFDGFSNFIRDAYEHVSKRVDRIFADNLFKETEKAIIRAAKRNAKKLM